jgi:protein-S-isoprenylcysteine O-methyltransferase Ste14
VHYLLNAGWIPCCIYGSVPSFWLLVHPYADFWRRRHREGKPVYQLLVPIWVAMWVTLYAATYPLRGVQLYPVRWAWVPGLLFFVVGTVLYAQGHNGFSFSQLVGFHELKPDQHSPQLSVRGIRQHVRHPVYLAHLCQMLAFSITTGLAPCWALTAFALVTGIAMVRAEERELVQRFGDSYRKYQQNVPMLIPRL